jgi:hypothetical protein
MAPFKIDKIDLQTADKGFEFSDGLPVDGAHLSFGQIANISGRCPHSSDDFCYRSSNDWCILHCSVPGDKINIGGSASV